MQQGKHVLLITNTVSGDEVIQVKDAICAPRNATMPIKISLVQVMPSLPTAYFNIPSMLVLADRYYQEARENLTRIGESLNVSKRDQWLIMGKVKTEVMRLATRLNVQFILASSAHLLELRKSLSHRREDQQIIINNLSELELCAE